ncbi:RNase A-like domain-containing protein [Luteimonas sp. R10]|uniref:RNase A-like domain-containing protein n=1 Tax=Luteimonas sp. R10 TaxID=3108176 RepID=UPI003085784A|nr:RNase A-like domain-containing protein [Luteimonas sp. R10]
MPPVHDARTPALEAAAMDVDLPQHISDLAQRGELADFLAQTDAATALAESGPVFAEQLDPLLDRIRDGLSQLSIERLPALERDAVAATLERLDAHLGPAEAPAPTGEVPGGGLQAHEDAGGHLIERHVGKSEQALVDRVRNENISAASSFRDLPEAEHFVAATLAEHGDRIDAWLGGEGGNRLVVDARFDASTGLSVARGESRAEDVFSVRLVLERSDRLDIGYRIVTGYPSAP